MRTQATILLTVLISATLRSAGTYALPDSSRSKRVGQLAVMTAPDGNQITIKSAPGKKLIRSSDLVFGESIKPVLAGSCAQTPNLNLRLGLTEYELELRLLIQKLRTQKKPRRLSKVQSDFIAEVPACEDFQWELAIISKLLRNYDLDKTRQVSLK